MKSKKNHEWRLMKKELFFKKRLEEMSHEGVNKSQKEEE